MLCVDALVPCVCAALVVSVSHTHEQYNRALLVPVPNTKTRHFRRAGTDKYVRLNAFHSPSRTPALATILAVNPTSVRRASDGDWNATQIYSGRERHVSMFQSQWAELYEPLGPNPPSLETDLTRYQEWKPRISCTPWALVPVFGRQKKRTGGFMKFCKTLLNSME
jgi:hypothetical protein